MSLRPLTCVSVLAQSAGDRATILSLNLLYVLLSFTGSSCIVSSAMFAALPLAQFVVVHLVLTIYHHDECVNREAVRLAKLALLYLNPIVYTLFSLLHDSPGVALSLRLIVLLQCLAFVKRPGKATTYLVAVNSIGMAMEAFINLDGRSYYAKAIPQFLCQLFVAARLGLPEVAACDSQTTTAAKNSDSSQTPVHEFASAEIQTQSTASQTAEAQTEPVEMIEAPAQTDSNVNIFMQFFQAMQHPGFIVDLNVNVQAAAPNIVNPSARALMRGHTNLFDEAKLEESSCTINELLHSFRRRVEHPSLKADRVRITPNKKEAGVAMDAEAVYDVSVATFDSNETRLVGIVMMETPKDREKEKQILEHFKTSLICFLSHELFSPINSLIMALNLLPNPAAGEKDDYKAISVANAELLYSKISDLIDYTKLGLSDFKLQEAEFNVDTLFEDLERILRYSVLQKGNRLSFKTHTSANRKMLIHADKSRIKQVLIKLITNANKYTEKGEILVTAADKADDLNVVFAVRDTGVGMNKEKVDQIFAPMIEKAKFLKEHNDVTANLPGMGLEIARSICECMGSSLRATSSQGKGSTFSFEVPICRIYTTPIIEMREIPQMPESPTTNRGSPSHPSSAQPVHPQRMQMFAAFRRSYIQEPRASQPSKWKERRRGSGTLNVSLADCSTSLSRSHRDLVNDFRMRRPGKLQSITERIDAWEIPAEQISENVSDVRAKMLQYSGAKKMATKAGEERMTTDPTGNSGLNTGRNVEQRLVFEPKEAQKQGVVLITDDDAFNRMVLKGIISRLKISTIEAVNGEEAVEAVRRSIQKGSRWVILMILMDLNMPIMDGIQATREIRKLEKAHSRVYKTPIVAVSAHNTESYQTLCFKVGMQEFASKPVQARDVERIVQTYVNTTLIDT